MGIFGWDYPAGCSGTPYDEDHPCAICGGEPESCECSECPVCGGVGDPACIKEHGLVLSEKVLAARAEALKRAQEQNIVESQMAQEYERDAKLAEEYWKTRKEEP